MTQCATGLVHDRDRDSKLTQVGFIFVAHARTLVHGEDTTPWPGAQPAPGARRPVSTPCPSRSSVVRDVEGGLLVGGVDGGDGLAEDLSHALGDRRDAQLCGDVLHAPVATQPEPPAQIAPANCQ